MAFLRKTAFEVLRELTTINDNESGDENDYDVDEDSIFHESAEDHSMSDSQTSDDYTPYEDPRESVSTDSVSPGELHVSKDGSTWIAVEFETSTVDQDQLPMLRNV
ncbi:unnamed protein product [Dicrocoelium dendriticum]|nr:unnamed protein product [Dicrocoelium dendriticum]